MIVDLRNPAKRRSYAVQRVREPETIEYVKQNVMQGQVCIDVGANVGVYTLLFSRLVGPTGHVYAFEPNPGAVRILKANIRLNGYENITVIPAAVSDTPGSKRFYINRHNGWSGLLPQEGVLKAITVDSVILDERFDTEVIDWIKVDVEGTELDVVRGMKDILRRNRQLKLIIEFRPSANAVELFQELQEWQVRSFDQNLVFWYTEPE